MLNRRKAPEFVINNGWDSLSESLRTFLTGKSSHANYCCDYPFANLLWVNPNYIDEVCQNSEFWDCLVSGEIMSRQRFKIRVKSDIIEDTPNDGLSNDNTMAMYYCDDSTMLINMSEYLSNEEYQNNFVLTAEYVDNIIDIQAWIRTRNIDSEFDLHVNDEVLKEKVKNYYNLTDDFLEG